LWSVRAPPVTATVWSTVYDLAEYATAFQNGRLVRPSTARTLLESSVGLGEGAYTTEWASASRHAYGRFLGRLADHQGWFHPGDNPGFQSLLGHLPESQTTVAVLSNADDVSVSELVGDSLREAGMST
jgi:Beta-lactamase